MPTTWTNQTKGGELWTYDQSGLTYDDATLAYESVGVPTTWTYESKS